MSYDYKKVAVLCGQKNGVYSQLSGVHRQQSQVVDQSSCASSQFSCTPNQLTRVQSQLISVDLWDKSRNAFDFKGGLPVVAHPPCRLWGQLKGMSKLSVIDSEIERDLGRHCVSMVIENGGVLEHPAGSDLFSDMGLPVGGFANEFGFTLELPQRMFGHSMVKNSWFFFSGIGYDQIIPIRPALHHRPLKKIEHLSALQRESTPPELASWLLVHAALCFLHSR